MPVRLVTKRKKDFAAAMVEMTLAFPLIILMIVFLIDTGLYLFQNSLLIDGTAAVNRKLVTMLGQREACLLVSGAGCVDCTADLSEANRAANIVRGLNLELYKGMQFKLQITPASAGFYPYRLVTLFGAFEFKCLTCKFFSILIPLTIKHQSVLVIERPQVGCASIAKTCISSVPCTLTF